MNEKHDYFADLDDSDFENAPVRDTATANPHVENIGDQEIPGFEETCSKCRGSGLFAGGRVTELGHNKCTKCKGKGKLYFKTSPEARAKASKSARKSAAKKAEKDRTAFLAGLDEDVRVWLTTATDKGDRFAADLIAKGTKYSGLTDSQIAAVRKCIARDEDAKAGVTEWAEQHEAEYKWLKTEAEAGNEFAGSLLDSVTRWGNLSERQLAAVQRNLDKVKEEVPSDLDISSLKGYYAVPDGDTRLKICVRKPGKNSRWHGWTFVDDGSAYGNRTNYGKQAPEGLYKGRIQEQLAAILKAPLEAQKAYGHLTGTCGRCGRLLEDEESIAAGIGPVCATKAG